MYRKVIFSLILYTLTVHQSIVLFLFATHFQAIFIHYKCDSNSRFVEDEDDNGKSRLERVLVDDLNIICLGLLPDWLISNNNYKTITLPRKSKMQLA